MQTRSCALKENALQMVPRSAPRRGIPSPSRWCSCHCCSLRLLYHWPDVKSFFPFTDILGLTSLLHEHTAAALKKHFHSSDCQCVSLQFTLQHPSCIPKSLPRALLPSLEGAGHTAPVWCWEVPKCRVSHIGGCCNACHSIQIQHSSYNKASLVLLHGLKGGEEYAMGFGCHEARQRHEGVGKQCNRARWRATGNLYLAASSSPPDWLEYKYMGAHNAQHFSHLICVSEQNSWRAGTERGEPLGSYLPCGAPAMEPPAPSGAGNRQVPPKQQCPFPSLSRGQRKPRDQANLSSLVGGIMQL